MSGIGIFPGLPADARASGEFGGRERLAYSVTCDVRQVPYSVEETQCIQHGGIDADPDIRITLFDAL
jgi:hypothetical protein